MALHAAIWPSTSDDLHQLKGNGHSMTAGGHSGIIIIQFDSLATIIQALGSGILLYADRVCLICCAVNFTVMHLKSSWKYKYFFLFVSGLFVPAHNGTDICAGFHLSRTCVFSFPLQALRVPT